MNATHYLYAAYIATVILHTGYILSLIRRYQGVRKKMRALKKVS